MLVACIKVGVGPGVNTDVQRFVRNSAMVIYVRCWLLLCSTFVHSLVEVTFGQFLLRLRIVCLLPRAPSKLGLDIPCGRSG